MGLRKGERLLKSRFLHRKGHFARLLSKMPSTTKNGFTLTWFVFLHCFLLTSNLNALRFNAMLHCRLILIKCFLSLLKAVSLGHFGIISGTLTTPFAVRTGLLDFRSFQGYLWHYWLKSNFQIFSNIKM